MATFQNSFANGANKSISLFPLEQLRPHFSRGAILVNVGIGARWGKLIHPTFPVEQVGPHFSRGASGANCCCWSFVFLKKRKIVKQLNETCAKKPYNWQIKCNMPLIETKTLWERHGRNGAIPATTTQQHNYEQVTCFLSSLRKRAATTMRYPTCAPHIVCDLQATFLLKNHLQRP